MKVTGRQLRHIQERLSRSSSSLLFPSHTHASSFSREQNEIKQLWNKSSRALLSTSLPLLTSRKLYSSASPSNESPSTSVDDATSPGSLHQSSELYSSASTSSESPLSVDGETSHESSESPPLTNENEKIVDQEQHHFKAETQKILQIVSHSLYTDKEVFLRELISNSADALEKLRFLVSSGQIECPSFDEASLEIVLSTDPKNRTITIEDTGVGMTKEELVEHLGTIAKSGTLEFLKNFQSGESNNTKDIIGQFGVGFYSAFVVSDKVEVYTRSSSSVSSPLYKWESDGSGVFTTSEVKDDTTLIRGTKIICHLKEDCLSFANVHMVKDNAKKFSSYINFPIKIREDNKVETIQTQPALWLQSNPTKEEHINFFRYISGTSWGEPMYTIMYKSDAPLTIRSVFYIPEDPPSRMFSSSNDSGVSIHCKKVLVKKHGNDFIPKWAYFIKGVIDCEDMPLNVSREHMQDTRLQMQISNVIVKKILRFLHDQSISDPEKYNAFYGKYSNSLKEGFLDDSNNGSRNRDAFFQVLRFESSTSKPKELVSLDKYLSETDPSQDKIYYYCCPNRDIAMNSPYMEPFITKKKPVLLMTSEIDDFLAMNFQNYKGKKFVAIDASEEKYGEDFEESNTSLKKDDLNIKDESRPHLSLEQQQSLQIHFKEVLGSKVTEVKFSDRLLNHPAIVTGFLSSTLRKMMKATFHGSLDAQSSLAGLPTTLELNSCHPLITSLYHLKDTNTDISKILIEQLYDNACVAAGIIEDPRSMLPRLNKLIELTSQYVYHHDKAYIEHENNNINMDNSHSNNADDKIDNNEKVDETSKDSTRTTINASNDNDHDHIKSELDIDNISIDRKTDIKSATTSKL